MAKTIEVRDDQVLGARLRGLVAAQGVLAILFGIVALFWPGLTVSLLLVFFGLFALIWAIVGIVTSLVSMGAVRLWWLELLFSVLLLGLGVYVLRNPVDAALGFVIFIGLAFIVRGLVDLVEGLFGKERDGDTRLFSVLVGIVGVIAGIVTFVYPVSAGVAVVWVIGLYGILYGTLAIAFAVRAHNAALDR